MGKDKSITEPTDVSENIVNDPTAKQPPVDLSNIHLIPNALKGIGTVLPYVTGHKPFIDTLFELGYTVVDKDKADTIILIGNAAQPSDIKLGVYLVVYGQGNISREGFSIVKYENGIAVYRKY